MNGSALHSAREVAANRRQAGHTSMFLRMLDSYPEAARRLRELLASRADQWAREMENVRTKLARNTGPRS